MGFVDGAGAVFFPFLSWIREHQYAEVARRHIVAEAKRGAFSRRAEEESAVAEYNERSPGEAEGKV